MPLQALLLFILRTLTFFVWGSITVCMTHLLFYLLGMSCFVLLNLTTDLLLSLLIFTGFLLDHQRVHLGLVAAASAASG